MTKKISFAVASAFGLGLIASASFAGPIVLGPAPMPAVHVAPVVHTVPVQTQILSTYRQVRAFWLSKAIVR